MSRGICVCSINSENGNESRVEDGVEALGKKNRYKKSIEDESRNMSRNMCVLNQ